MSSHRRPRSVTRKHLYPLGSHSIQKPHAQLLADHPEPTPISTQYSGLFPMDGCQAVQFFFVPFPCAVISAPNTVLCRFGLPKLHRNCLSERAMIINRTAENRLSIPTKHSIGSLSLHSIVEFASTIYRHPFANRRLTAKNEPP